MPLNNSDLTKTEFDRKVVRGTVPGMAYFANTGPSRMTCGDCEYLVPALGKSVGTRCQKYFWMMRAWGKVNVPPSTASCKYFSEKG